jgi:hypothetical protein
MRNWLGVVVVVGVGGITSLACSSNAADKYPTTESFCAAKAVEECQIVSLCAVSLDACKQTRAGLCNAAAVTATSTSRKYTPGNAQACIDKMHTLYGTKGSLIIPADLDAADQVCEHVFSGTVANNAACTTSFDCASTSSICDKGLCGPKTDKKLGDGCANAGEVCTDGLSFCSKTTPNVCVASKKAGEACDANDPCTSGLRCDVTCQSTFVTGQACKADSDCAASAPFCDRYNGYVCDAGLIFAPSAKALCALYGGTAP